MSNLDTEPRRWFRDSRGNSFCVQQLSLELAQAHADWLVRTHNTIPFQHWTQNDLLASGDPTRSYLDKWDISRIAVSPAGLPLAFCIGFEMRPDHQYYHEPGIYLHRLAVAPEYRGRTIGLLVQAETIFRAFHRGLYWVGNKSDPVVIFGQTSEALSNNNVRLFHKAAGFREVGKKPYQDRVDLVLRMEARDFWASPHVRKWKSAQISGNIAGSVPSSGAELSDVVSVAESSFADNCAASHSEITTGVKDVLAHLTGIPYGEIVLNDKLGDLLAMDSLSMTELWLSLEERFRVHLLGEQISEFETVDEIANYLVDRVVTGAFQRSY